MNSTLGGSLKISKRASSEALHVFFKTGRSRFDMLGLSTTSNFEDDTKRTT
jgi:hypothetical protein